MHGLTKALVLLAALASIFLAALTMAFQVNAETLRTELVAERAAADAMEAKANVDAQQHSQVEQRLMDDYKRLQTEVTSLKNQALTLQSANEQLRNDRLAAQQEAEQAKNQNAQIAGTVQTHAEVIRNFDEEVRRLRQGELGWKQDEIALADRIADLESQLEVLNQANRALQEQLHLAQTGGGDDGEPRGGVVVPSVGRVLSVERDRATGATLARIDLGTNDGIFLNQTVYVTRGRDTFVGHLTIITTDLQWSIGRFNDLGTGAQIQADDMVLTSFRR